MVSAPTNADCQNNVKFFFLSYRCLPVPPLFLPVDVMFICISIMLQLYNDSSLSFASFGDLRHERVGTATLYMLSLHTPYCKALPGKVGTS